MDVTLLTCTPDGTSPLFREHQLAINNTYPRIQHIIFQNGHSPQFNHAREINRAMSICQTRFLVTLDDDVIVKGEWLDGLLSSQQKSSAAVVGGVHRWRDGRINHSGGWILRDGRGNHYDAPISDDSFFPYVCSAISLVDVSWCKELGLSFDESFIKYYQEVDFCLRVWEAGGRVVSTPKCDVIHVVGQAMANRIDHKSVDQRDKNYFMSKWFPNRRLEELLKVNDSVFAWGGYRITSDYGDFLDGFDSLADSGIVHELHRLRSDCMKFTVTGHGKNILSLLDERIRLLEALRCE